MSKQPSPPATRRQFVVLAGGAAVSCALPACTYRHPYNAQAIDLRGFNMCNDEDECPDLSMPAQEDLSQPPPPPDLRGVDLRGANADLRDPPDLSRPPDLRPPQDLSAPPDLTTPPDLAGTCKILVPSIYMPGLNQARYWPDYRVFFARDAKGYMALWNYCQHAGCPTSFNAGALTFDCPCHGSRYNFDGSVLLGPTTEPLFHQAICWQDDTKRAFLYDDKSYIQNSNQRLT